MRVRLKNIVTLVRNTTLKISIVSFLMSFSSAIIISTMVIFLRTRLGEYNLNLVLTWRGYSETFGYLFRVLLGICSGILSPKTILLFLYGVVFIVKPAFIISSLDLSKNLCTISFIIANTIEKSSSAARDIVRDLYVIVKRKNLSDNEIANLGLDINMPVIPQVKYMNEANIGVRKIFSNLGTIFGAITSYIYLCYSNHYTVLFILAGIPGVLSWFILFFFIPKYPPKLFGQDLQQVVNKFEFKSLLTFNSYKVTTEVLVSLLFIILLYLGRISETRIFSKICDITSNPQWAPLSFLIYYISGLLSAFIIILFKNNSFLLYIPSIFLIITNIIALNINSVYSLITVNIFSGIFNGIVDSILYSSLIILLHDYSISSILILLSVMMSIGSFLSSTLAFYLSNNLTLLFTVSLIPNIISFLLCIYLNKKIIDHNK